jgi:hypothetical protein
MIRRAGLGSGLSHENTYFVSYKLVWNSTAGGKRKLVHIEAGHWVPRGVPREATRPGYGVMRTACKNFNSNIVLNIVKTL